ncbi:MAG: hypothetical protein WCK02_16905 [Bacteroidota bacterium]
MDYYLLTYRGSLKGDSGEAVNAKYDLTNACPKCGTGAVLIGNLPIRTPDKKEFYETFVGDLIISNRIVDEFKSTGIKIDHLKQIVHYKSFEPLPFYHLVSNVNLPKMTSESKGYEISSDQCKFCKRDGFSDVLIWRMPDSPNICMTSQYDYRIEDETILQTSDIFQTWECFGRSWLQSIGDLKYHYARPRIIVKQRIKDIFERLKIKFADFERVTINSNK